MKILLLDNHDSFTWNLVQQIEECDAGELTVLANDSVELSAVVAFDIIILSPGPGLPRDAGLMPELLRRYAPSKPILGVCLGHQALAEHFGAKLYNLNTVFHGVASLLENPDATSPLYHGLRESPAVGRYHSWAVSAEDFPAELKVTGKADGVIMSLEHRTLPLFGVQYHPESYLTDRNLDIVRRFLEFRT